MIYLGVKKLLKAILEESQIDCLAIYNTGKHVLFRIFTRRQLEIKTIPQKLREKSKKNIVCTFETHAKGSMSRQMNQST
jgi:hypothetical protein